MKKIFIISDIGDKAGLGHYSRSKTLTKEINFFFKKNFKIYNFYFSKKIVNIEKNKSIKITNLKNYILKHIIKISPDIIIFNVSRFLEPKLYQFVKKLKNNFDIKLIAIDGFINKSEFFEKIWVPNVTLKHKKDFNKKNILFGWDKIIIDKIKIKKKQSKNIKVLFILGGTDRYKIGNRLPKLVEKKFDKNVDFLWVKGPYASKPKIYEKKRWKIIENKLDLKNIYRDADVAFVVMGVSFFEILHQEIPSVLFFHKKKIIDHYIIDYLKKSRIDVTVNLNKAVEMLYLKIKFLKQSNIKARKLSKNVNFKNRKNFLKKILF